MVIFDEITASVDREAAARMMDLIRTRFVSRTVLIIAHQLWTIQDCNRIAVMDQGQLAEWGEPRELLQQRTMFRGLWEAQNQ